MDDSSPRRSAPEDGASTSQPHHLVLLVHGLADTHHAWDRCVAELDRMPNAHEYLFHSSAVNGRFRTHDGFDRCGERLAEELRGLLAAHPQLRHLTVLGHSMGGMIARYALGVLYRPEDGSIAGLAPRHLVTLATPHLGLTVDDGPAQVPFVAWSGRLPLLGPGLQRALQSAAHIVASRFFRSTGRHFLALDGGPGEAPLLMRLAMDEPQQ
ncbi:hypothetical protein GPECTOR_926g184 [Gonium pectorale]|uniref:DUF676 domain-containing protein n=1 Tax=Gonium pectorale TaxID=33097 RepID=A0A150FTT5_GONPE|nr:hypothetical protein GPECTOR_926g184 [Gonium pectorale]|eukprot:KXZ41037.1 hypothetical protein GPECTOR_926g184 [Gonium pectorale]